MSKLIAISLVCLAVSATATHAQGPAALSLLKKGAPEIVRIIRPSPALIHEIVTAGRFSRVLLGPQERITESILKGTDPGAFIKMLEANNSALTRSLAERAAGEVGPTIIGTAKEAAKIKFNPFDGKVKFGELIRIGPASIDGELNVYKLVAIGAVGLAVCKHTECYTAVLDVISEDVLNMPDLGEIEEKIEKPKSAKPKRSVVRADDFLD